MSHNRENPLYPTVRGEGGVAGEGKFIAWLASFPGAEEGGERAPGKGIFKANV